MGGPSPSGSDPPGDLDTYYNADFSGLISGEPNGAPEQETVRLNRGWSLVADLLAPAFAGAAPVLFLPILVDAYVLPRAALTLLFGGLLFGAGLAVAAWRGRPTLGSRSLAVAVGAVAAAALLAFAFSVNQSLSIAGAYSRYESLVTRLAYLGLFCGAVWLASARGRRWVEVAYVLGCSIAGVEAIYQWAARSPFRPDGNLGQAGLLGALLAMALPLALQAGLRYRPWLLSLVPLVGGLLVSTSRAGWLGAVVAAFVYAAFAASSTRRRRVLAAVGVLGAAAAVLLLLVSPLRTLNSDTGSARLGVWRDAVRMAAARPLTGWGEDATGLVFGRYQSEDWEPGNTFDRIHDQPLDLLVTQGVLGGAAALAMWGLFWVGAWRAAGRGVLPAGVPGLLGAVAGYQCWELINFDWAPATGPVFLLAGIAWAGIASSRPFEGAAPATPTAEPPAWRRQGALVAGVAVAVLAAWLAVTAVSADRYHYLGRNPTAVRLDPLQAFYHQALGEQLGSSTPAGLAELRRAFELGDYDYGFCVELGDAALAAGDRALARAAYTRADQVYRFDPKARDKLRAMGPG